LLSFVGSQVKATYEQCTGFPHASLTLLSSQWFLTDSQQKEGHKILQIRKNPQKTLKAGKPHPQTSGAA
jgi:hypothetical protein